MHIVKDQIKQRNPQRPKATGMDDSAMRRSSSRAFERQESPPPYPPLHLAAMRGDVEKITSLLQAGADIEQPDNDDGATALVDACQHNKPEAALELIKQGAKIDAKSKGGATAIGWAAANGMVEVGRCLILKGCDLNVPFNGCDTTEALAYRNRDQYPDFYRMVAPAIEVRDKRLAVAAQAAAEAKAEAFSNGATVLNSPLTVTKPITLKR